MTAAAVRPDHVPAHQAAYGALSRRDGGLARLIALDGTPDPCVWGVLEDAGGRDAFAELALHIVSQQISTAAALTIFGRLRDKLSGEIEPAAIIATSTDDLRAAGSRAPRPGRCTTSPSASLTAGCPSRGSPAVTTPPPRPSLTRCLGSGRGPHRCSCCTTSGDPTSSPRAMSDCYAPCNRRSA